MNERDRFDKFTERARKVLSLAQEEAQRFQHNYIGTEHLLLGLVREGEGVAAKVLNNLGVELERVRSAVEFIIGRGDRIVLGEVGLTPRAKKVIELAVDEARRLNHHYIGTEHLLLGLVREGEGIAAGVLESLGVNLEKVRRATLEVLSGSSSVGRATPPPSPAVPAEAASLVAEGEPALTCSYCGARSPGYFRYCFNCGKRLVQE
jgi:ATP-dependent Clp protease ATP-binding subunit ClpC